VALTHLVDTSVLKRLERPEIRAVVEPLAAIGRLGRPTICDLEIGYSARTSGEWDILMGALAAFDAIETTAAHFVRALQVQRLLAERSQRSQRGRKIPELLVAAAAEALDLGVLHYGGDFDQIAAVTGQPCMWVLPAGSVA
jgi:predicted nucleic acid-binding protein